MQYYCETLHKRPELVTITWCWSYCRFGKCCTQTNTNV